MVAKGARSSKRSSREEKEKNESPEAERFLSPASPPAAGEANIKPEAASSSPLLTRPDGSPGEINDCDKSNMKKKKKSRLDAGAKLTRLPRSRPDGRESDRKTKSRSPAREQLKNRTEDNDSLAHRRRLNPAPQVRSSFFWSLVSSCVCLRSSLRVPTSETELPELSPEAISQLRSLDTVASKSHVEVIISHTDNMPFASSSSSNYYGHPIVVVHLVDICSGLPIQTRHQSPPARFSTHMLNAFEWNASHVWTSLQLAEFVTPRTIVLFELVESRRRKVQPSASRWTQRRSDQHSGANKQPREDQHSSRAQHRHLAWCFFKPVSDRGTIRLPSIALSDVVEPPRKALRLQLLAWQPLSWADTHQARQKLQWNPQSDEGVPAVFLQYQRRTRTRLPCSLHVEIHPVVSNIPTLGRDTSSATDQSKLNTENTTGEHQEPPENESTECEAPQGMSSDEDLAPATSTADDPLFKCKRLVGEPCIVPKRVLYRLPTGRKGCSCVAFSPDGLLLAAAIHQVTATADEWVVNIHQVNTGGLWQSCHGHQSMIYSLEWGIVGVDGAKALASSSSDGSVMLWRLRGLMQPSATAHSNATLPSQIYQHLPSPVFVYCAIFHATQSQIVVSGASDGIIRFWNVRVEADPTLTKSTRLYDSAPVYLCNVSRQEGENPAIHSICMESKLGGRLFCGDASGTITVWSPASTTTNNGELGYELAKIVRTGQRSVAHLALHPRKQHLLALTHPHALLQYETRSFLLLHKNYSGVDCDRLLVQTSFSPDGQCVVSGSEDGVPHVFDAVKGQRLDDSSSSVWGRRFFHGFPLMGVAWSPTSHLVAIVAYGETHPIVVLCAYREDRTEDATEELTTQGIGQLHAGPKRPWRYSGKQPDPAEGLPAFGGFGRQPAQQGADADDPSESERHQRTLARRQQRLQAKLAREALVTQP